MSGKILVSNSAELYKALAAATGGETIELAGGNYGALTLNSASKFDITWPDTVTITSADPDDPAVFSKMDLKGVENLTFDGLVFDYTFSGNRVFGNNTMLDYLVNVNGSSNVTIRNSVFDGDTASGTGTAADGYGAGTAIGVGGSTNITIENNEISNFQRGLAPAYSTNVVIRGNDISGLRTDGMNIIQMKGITIEDNYIHDFNRSPTSGDHSDMIQFWTNGTKAPSTDVVIDGNIFDIGKGDLTQTIFMGNEAVGAGAGEEMYYKNIQITDNVILNGHSNAIRVGAADGVVISGNTLVHAGNSTVAGLPVINVDGKSHDVTVTGNTAAGFPVVKGQSDWTVGDNTTVQTKNPAAPGYYDDVREEAENAVKEHLGGSTGGSTGGGVETPDTGEDTGEKTDGGVEAPGQSTGSGNTDDGGSTGGGHTAEPGKDDGAVTPVVPKPAHDYDLAFDGTDTFLQAQGNAKLNTGDAVLELDGAGYGWLGRMNDFGNSDQLSMSVDFSQDTPGNGKETLVWNHMKLGVTLNGDGLIIGVGTADGYKTYGLKDLGLNDTDQHNLKVQIDAENDRLQVILDGEVVLNDTETDFEIVGAGGRQWGWHLGGNPWSAGLDGTISDFTLDRSVNFDTTQDDHYGLTQ